MLRRCRSLQVFVVLRHPQPLIGGGERALIGAGGRERGGLVLGAAVGSLVGADAAGGDRGDLAGVENGAGGGDLQEND